MTRLSMSEIWDETVRFVAREKALIFPTGFATFGLGMLVMMAGAPEAASGQVPPGPWMLWFVPGLVLATIGYLAVSAMVLEAGISVREALAMAIRRLPTAIMVSVLLAIATILLLSAAAILFGAIGAGAGWSLEKAGAAAVAVALPVMFWVSVRLVAIWPLLVARETGPIDALRNSFRLTAGHGWRLAGVAMLALMAYLVLTGVAQIVAGSLFLLVGKAIGAESLGRVLTETVVAAVAGGLATVWSVFVALLYRRLS